MLELRFIRENLELVMEKMRFRGMETGKIEKFAEIDRQRRDTLSEVEGLRNKRKTASQEIANLKKGGENADSQMAEMREVGDRIKELERSLQKIEVALQEIVMEIPNLCHETIPQGKDDSDNQELRKWGGPAGILLQTQIPFRTGRGARHH